MRKTSTSTQGALHRLCQALPGQPRAAELVETLPHHHGQGMPRQPRSSGAQATCPWSWDTGHRTPCDRPGSHSMEWPRMPRRAYGRGGSHTRLWGSRQVTLLLCTSGVFPASEQR